MNEHDPSFSAQALSWLINAVFALALLIGRMTFKRSMDKQDDLEGRIRQLEKESVTHSDLQRIEDKFDKLVDRLDRILDRQAKP